MVPATAVGELQSEQPPNGSNSHQLSRKTELPRYEIRRVAGGCFGGCSLSTFLLFDATLCNTKDRVICGNE
jgi:hypothetical protein